MFACLLLFYHSLLCVPSRHKTRFVRFFKSLLCCTSTSTRVEHSEKTSEFIHTFEFVRVSRPNFLRVKHSFSRRHFVETSTFPKGKAGLKRKIRVLQKGRCDVKDSRTDDTAMEPSPKTYQTEDTEPNKEVDDASDTAEAVERPKAVVPSRKSQPSSSKPKQAMMVDYERKKSVPGGTDPDVVLFFIHGVGGSLDVWRSQLDFFSQQGYETIALDLLGHGDSSAPKIAAAYTFYALSKEVTCIFKKYARRRNILIGHSYGTSFCIYLAHSYPERVHKMVLLSGGPPRPLWPGYRFLSSLSSCILCCLYPLLRWYFLKAGFAHQGSRAMRLLNDHKAFSVSPFVLRSIMQGQYWPEGDRRYHAQIAAPTLLIHGFHDEFVTIDDGIEMATTLPNASLKIVEEGGHMLMIECPDVVNAIMNEFFLADHGDFLLQGKYRKTPTEITSAPESPFQGQLATDGSEMSNDPEGTHVESPGPRAENPEVELGADVQGGATQWGALEALETLESAGHSAEKPESDILRTLELCQWKQISAGLLGYHGGASVC